MKRAIILSACGLASVACGVASGQAIGPDVIVGDLTGVSNYTAQVVNGVTIEAFSVGTTSCNRGDVRLQWFANVNQHPVIGQSIYRWRPVNGAGQFDQIGSGHLKHGFTALQGTVCFSDCSPNPDGTYLGVHCSDPYGSSLNGQQSGLGPRDEVNPYTGNYRYPFTSRSFTGSIARRIQVKTSDLNPTLNPGAIYFCEGQYVAADDATNGNGFNNTSYRRIIRGGTEPNYTFANSGSFPTQRMQSAIYGWATAETGVTIFNADVPGEGRFEVGYKVTPIAGGMFHYEYAIHNLNSDRAARGFVVNFENSSDSACIALANQGFNAVPYHSGEPYDATPWTSTKTASGQQWMSTQTYDQNVNANALRWMATYTFRFDSNREPIGGTGSILLFKPGTPSQLSINIPVPGIPGDYNQDGNADQDDVWRLIGDIASGTTSSSIDPDYTRDGNRDQNDVAVLINKIAGGSGCP